MSCFSKKIIKSISWVLLFVSVPAWAGPTMMALSYEVKSYGAFKYKKHETEKLTDRLREELLRRFGSAVYNKEESQFLFSYFKESSDSSFESAGGRRQLEVLEKAKEAYFNLKLDESRKLLQELFQNESQEAIVESYLLKGLVEFAQGNIESAKSAFREAHRLDDRRVLENRYFPPKVIKLYDQIKSESYPKAQLKVDSNPIGTEVWMNGVLLGLAPQTFEVPAGKHWISLRANHYQSSLQKLDLKEGASLTLKRSLAWLGNNGKNDSLVMNPNEDQDILSDRMTHLGSQIGAAKIALFTAGNDRGQDIVETRIIDVKLRTAHKIHRYIVPQTMTFENNSAEISQQIIDQVQAQLSLDLKSKPDQYVENRFRGDIVLVGYRRKYFFESPWFWGLLGAAGLGIGLGLALTGGSAASTGTLGITFQ